MLAWPKWFRAWGVAAAVAALASPTSAQNPAPFPSADGAALMVVMDGSGSMWARLDGERQAKFVTVREALAPVLGRIDPKVPVGLTTFGTRRRGDCSDVAVAVPAEPGTERVTAVLNRLNPQGKSPLAAAIREAAKALPKGSGPRSLIVIHDDFDNCNADPCSVLGEVQAAAPGVVIHTVGVGLPPEDAPRLQCLTGPTGGRVIDGSSPAAIATGLQEVVEVALRGGASLPPRVGVPAAADPRPAPSVAPAPTVAASVRPSLRADGAPGVRLATVLVAGQGPRTTNATWVVRKADAPADALPIFAGRGQDIVLPAPAGTYVVEVRDGLVRHPPVRVVVPDSGQIGLDIELGAGLLRVPTAPSAVWSLDDALIGVFARTADGRPGAALDLIRPTEPDAALAVPKGAWIVRVAEGNMRLDRSVDVTAGSVVDLGSTWPFGRVQLAVTTVGDPVRDPVVVMIYEDDPDAPLGRREVVRSAASTPDLPVPVGTYTIVARQGQIEARDRIVVQGGTVVRRSLALAGARLSLTSRLAGPAAPVVDGTNEEPVAYRIERLDVAPIQVFTANRAVADFTLPAGRYRIEARQGLANARVSRDVVLSSGETIALTMDHPAALVTFVPPARSGVIAWEVLDLSGRVVWTSAQLRPRATLLAGRYTVRLETRDRRLERVVEVRPGAPVAVEMAE